MDLKRFKENLTPLLLTSAGDNAFAVLRIAIHGMSGVRTAKILNFASKCMDQGEFYLEVGTFSGYTLISSGYQLNAMCIGIDNLAFEGLAKPEDQERMRNNMREVLKNNLTQYSALNAQFIEADFRNVIFPEDVKGKLGVLFIDGVHTKADVRETIEKFSPYFSKDAVIVFDDVQFGEIPSYLAELMLSGEYEMLAYLVSTAHPHDKETHQNKFLDENIANGICVMARRGNDKNS